MLEGGKKCCGSNKDIAAYGGFVLLFVKYKK